jgi:hypothetical protein
MSDYPTPDIQVLGPGVVLLRGVAAVEAMHLVNAGYRVAESRKSVYLGRFRLIRTAFRKAYELAEMSSARHDDTTSSGVASDSVVCEEDGRPLSTADAAKLLGVTVRTVQRKAPELGGFLVGGSWVFDESAVLALKAQRAQRNEDRRDCPRST